MKKHNEGYTLPLVMVVMVILCLVAVSIMSVALRNLKAQQASVQRTQDQYVAAGMIEKVVAQLESIGENEVTLGYIAGEIPKDYSDCLQISLVVDESKEIRLDKEYKNPEVSTISVEDVNASLPLTFEITATSGQVQISCTVDLKCNPTITYQGNELIVKIKGPSSIEYISYEVEYITTSETGGGQE